MENTIRSRTKTNKKHNSHTKRRRKYEKLKKGNMTDTGIQSKQSNGLHKKSNNQSQRNIKLMFFNRNNKKIILIIRELWLKRNIDHHQPIKRQQRIATMTETTRIVTDLYSLQPLVFASA